METQKQRNKKLTGKEKVELFKLLLPLILFVINLFGAMRSSTDIVSSVFGIIALNFLVVFFSYGLFLNITSNTKKEIKD